MKGAIPRWNAVRTPLEKKLIKQGIDRYLRKLFIKWNVLLIRIRVIYTCFITSCIFQTKIYNLFHCLFQLFIRYIYIQGWEVKSWNWGDSFYIIQFINCRKYCFNIEDWPERFNSWKKERFSMISFNLQRWNNNLKKWLQGTLCSSNNKPGLCWCLANVRQQIHTG